MDWILKWILIGLGSLVAFIILVFLMGRWGDWRLRRKVDSVFASREPLSEAGFYEKYFQDRGVPFDVVIKMREILESELNADLSRLSADDDFTKELSFFWEEDSMADVELLVRIEEEFGIKIQDEEAGLMFTSMNTMIETVMRKLTQSSTPNK